MLTIARFCLVSILMSGVDGQVSSSKDLARLHGVWRFALVEVEGVKQAEVPFEKNQLIISRDGSYVIVQGDRITRGTIKIDPGKNPKHYDVEITAGPAKGLKAAGIYELEGDNFKICLPLRGKDRPAALASTRENGCMLHVFKRVDQPVQEALVSVARQELAGTWQAVSYALDGNQASPQDMKKIQLIFDAQGNTKALNDGKLFIATSTTVDPSVLPMTIDLKFTEGDLKGKSSLGIYRIEKGVLTICRAAPGNPRPTEFSSLPGSGQTLMSYEQVKKQQK